jgi:hypothetical protein
MTAAKLELIKTKNDLTKLLHDARQQIAELAG